MGTRHSFNGIADSTVAQISTLGLNDLKLDAAAKTVTAGAGIKYGDLAVQLDKAGFALANMASLPHISVGGSIATGTHGSGLRNGGLATSVSGLEFVAADGTLHTLTREKDGDTFHGAVVSMDSMSIVTHVTLDVEPSYEITQIVYQELDFHELEHAGLSGNEQTKQFPMVAQRSSRKRSHCLLVAQLFCIHAPMLRRDDCKEVTAEGHPFRAPPYSGPCRWLASFP